MNLSSAPADGSWENTFHIDVAASSLGARAVPVRGPFVREIERHRIMIHVHIVMRVSLQITTIHNSLVADHRHAGGSRYTLHADRGVTFQTSVSYTYRMLYRYTLETSP